MSYVIGITGGIGSGKTLVSDQLVAEFGENILMPDGNLNRSELREIAFSSPQRKKTLDQITHPAIRDKTYQQIELVTTSYCLVVVPLLKATSPFIELMQRVLVVTAKRNIKIERVKKRSQLSKEEVIAIMETQLDDSERLSFANDVLNNNSSIEKVFEQVEHLHRQYLSLATSSI